MLSSVALSRAGGHRPWLRSKPCSGAVLVIIHSGQTGVERGAHDGAVAAGLVATGFMPIDNRDELGHVPPAVARCLMPCFERGARQALRANLEIASAVLCIVPTAAHVESVTAMPWLLQAVRVKRLGLLVCDGHSNTDEVASWALGIPDTCGSQRLMVTGPRGTRWPDGERVARRLVHAIAAAAEPDVVR